jgi:transposase
MGSLRFLERITITGMEERRRSMALYAGVDLGKRKSQVKVITHDRRVIQNVKIENSQETFRGLFEQYKGEVDVVCEASSNAFWLVDILEPIVRSIQVGHTSKIRWIAEARIKTDKLDAGILAELRRADLFPVICVPPKRIRELRELVRGLIRMRRQAVRCRNQVHGLLGRQGIHYKRSEMSGTRLGELVQESKLSRPSRIAAEAILRLEKAAQEEVKHLEAAIKKELRGEPELRSTVERLESIPGVGFFSALLFVVELWDITRFRNGAHLASYIGFVPSTHQTGQTMWHGRMTRQGNVLVRWILVQDAWTAVRQHPFFRQRYEHYKARKGNARAIVPVARALLDTIHRVWTEKKSYWELYEKKAYGRVSSGTP